MRNYSDRLKAASLLRLVRVGQISARKAVLEYPRDVQDESLIAAYHALIHYEADEDIRARDALYKEEQDDYLNMIARCRDKKTSIRREENQEKNSVESRINAEYQVQINEVNNRVQKRNQSDEVFARKKNEDLEKIISQRDNKIKSELDKITIKYNEQYNHVDLSEADLKKKLSQMTFTLFENAVIVRVDEFRNNDKPQNYPIMVQSIHHLVNYRYPTRYVMASSEEDNDDEFDMIEEAKENNGFSGEIKYSVLPSENAETFSIKISSVRVYLKDSGQTLVNDSVNKVIAENVTAASDIKVESSTNETLSQGKKLQGKTQSKKKIQMIAFPKILKA